MKLTALFIILVTVFIFTEGILCRSHKKKKEKKDKKEKKEKKGYKEQDESPYQLFSTSTAYDTVRGKIKEFHGCKPETVWAFFRHGTRYPHIREMVRYRKLEALKEKIIINHINGNGALSKYQLDSLRDWRFKGTDEQEMLLTLSGYEELNDLGKRLKKEFSDIFNKKNLQSINVKRTSAIRTDESAVALLKGLYGSDSTKLNRVIDDSLLKNTKQCPFWKNTTKSPALKKHISDYGNSSEIASLISNVNKRLGFTNEITFDVVKDMFDVCAFETSWYHGKYSTWCGAFSNKELQLMEYLEDLTYYWKSGYGNNYTSKLGCNLVRDMLEKLNPSENVPKASTYFSHSSGMRELLVSLGIGKCKEDLPGDKYVSPIERNDCWRTSLLTPFSANMISVLYKCKTKKAKEYKVGVFVNEKLVEIPHCQGKELCELETFKNGYSSLVDQSYCNREFCFKDSNTTTTYSNYDEDDDD